jgi:hypothetical protein
MGRFAAPTGSPFRFLPQSRGSLRAGQGLQRPLALACPDDYSARRSRLED